MRVPAPEDPAHGAVCSGAYPHQRLEDYWGDFKFTLVTRHRVVSRAYLPAYPAEGDHKHNPPQGTDSEGSVSPSLAVTLICANLYVETRLSVAAGPLSNCGGVFRGPSQFVVIISVGGLTTSSRER